MSWTTEETFVFIEMYKNESVIWNPEHKYHKDRVRVSEAWNRIADTLQIPVIELKKRKETLMTAFRLHYKKKQKGILSGAREEQIHKPIWIYYDALEAFLNGIYESKAITKTDDNASTSSKQENDYDEDNVESKRKILNTERKNSKLKIPVLKRRFNSPPEAQDVNKEMATAISTLNRILKDKQKSDQEDEDECELYGRLLTKKLRQFSHSDRQEIMYEIDGLLLNRICVSNRTTSPTAQDGLESPNESTMDIPDEPTQMMSEEPFDPLQAEGNNRIITEPCSKMYKKEI